MGEYDRALRMMMQRMAEDVGRELARGQRVESAARPEWLGSETQLVRGELRLDRLFPLNVAGELRLLHIELQLTTGASMADRMAEYDGVLRMTARRNGATPSQLQSVVILLEGDETPDEGWVEEVVGWREHSRKAPRYYQEPVYLRSVDELLARGPWWWIFVPLARDCDVEGIERAVLALRQHVAHDLMRAELLAAMRLFAERRERSDGKSGLATPVREEMETMSSSSSSWITELPFGKELAARLEARAEARGQTRGRDEGRREEIMRFASELLDDAACEQLRDIEDLDELERTTLALIKQRSYNGGDA